MEGTEEQEIQQPPEPQPEESLEGEITKEIETGKKAKKPRSEAQKAAFAKARKALAEKRALAKEEKKKPKPKPQPEPEPEIEAEPKPKPKRKPKRTVHYVEESSSEDSSSEEEVVYVQRKKPQRKKKEPKAPRVIYVSDSDEDDYQQTPDINQLYSFV